MAAAAAIRKRTMTKRKHLRRDVIGFMNFYHFSIILAGVGVTASLAEPVRPIAPAVVAAAERGEAEAEFQLARAYLRGEGVCPADGVFLPGDRFAGGEFL